MSKKILVADDSLTIRKVVELTFLEAEYEVLTAADGEEAGERLTDDVDVFIVDVHMPDRSGYELCKAAKAERPDLPVILLVGTFEQFDEAEMESSGADGLLRKPFDSQELASLVEELTGTGAEDDGEEESSDNVVRPVFGATSDASGTGKGGDKEDEGDEVVSQAEPAETDEEEFEEPTRPGVLSVAISDVETTSDEGEEALVMAMDDTPDELIEESASIAEGAEPETSAGDANETSAAVSAASEALGLTDDEVERIARRVVALLSDDIVRRVAWEVVPDLAEVVVKERIEELESELSDS